MEKRGQAKIIVVILIILMVLALIIILWIVLLPLIKSNIEIAEIKADLIRVNIRLDDVDGDFGNNPNQVRITLSRGADKSELIGLSEVNVPVIVDFVSAVDVSSSMGTSVCSNNDPSCNTQVSCESDVCGEAEWNTKLEFVRTANTDLMNAIFESNQDHRMGLVAYFTKIDEDVSHKPVGFDERIDFLLNNIGQLSIGSGTSICTGVNRAIEYLKDSNRFKAMIVMSDGGSNVFCDTNDADQDSIDSAQRAFEEHNIEVHTIGFGSGSGGDPDFDEPTLISMAEVGGGTYSFADVSRLSSIYDDTISEIVRQYKEDYNWNHLKIIFYSDTSSYVYKHYKIPGPLETITYEVPIAGDLSTRITDITRIDVYMAVITTDGTEVLSPLLGRFRVEKV